MACARGVSSGAPTGEPGHPCGGAAGLQESRTESAALLRARPGAGTGRSETPRSSRDLLAGVWDGGDLSAAVHVRVAWLGICVGNHTAGFSGSLAFSFPDGFLVRQARAVCPAGQL